MKKASELTENLNIFKLIKLLRKMKIFKPFSDTDIRLFLESGTIKEYTTNEIIVREGDREYSVYFLLSGVLHVIKNDKRITTLQTTGEIFGEMGIVDGSATVKAASNALTLCVDKSILDDKLAHNDYSFCYTLYRIFAEVLAERLRTATGKTA